MNGKTFSYADLLEYICYYTDLRLMAYRTQTTKLKIDE